MPLVVSPSERSTKAWGSFAKWPLRLDIAILLTGFVTLLFSLSSGVFHVGAKYFQMRYVQHDPAFFAADSADRISVDVIVPIVAMGVAMGNIWIYTTRVIAPGVSVATSLIGVVIWAIMLVYWTPLITGRHGLASMYAVRVICVIGGLVEVLLYAAYLVYSALAIHQLLRRSKGGARDSNVPSGQELESRRVSHAYVGEFNAGRSFGQASEHNSGLAPPGAEYPRRRSSANPFSDPVKGPSVESRAL